jgi:tRNA modification GTPase
MPADTIYALGTGAARTAIAVIRLSGPQTRDTALAFAGVLPPPRKAQFVTFRHPDSGETLDQGLVLWFPAPASSTGEDYAEFQVHGGPAVIEAFLTILHGRPKLREAQPGEFARRSFENGKLDLSQVEALADLIDAQTAFQRRQALRIMGGDLRRRVESWRLSLIDALALITAELDFSDEEDVRAAPLDGVRELLGAVLSEMRETLRAAPASERLREGFAVFILGPPNAGKSTLMNALARRDIAIVSEIPGTTRDLIEAHLDVKGMPVIFVDTAGLRESRDEIEKIGVARTLERARQADLLLWLSEGGAAGPPDSLAAEQEGVEILLVGTKSDLRRPAPGWLAISAQAGEGLEELLDAVFLRARERMGDGSSSCLLRRRHRDALEEASGLIESALAVEKPLEVMADELHGASRALGRIVGTVDVEQVLDAIFSQFCIGK